MPELRLIPLEETLTKVQLSALERQLKESGVDQVPLGQDADVDLEEALTEEQLTDFMDRLDARDLACDLYLPVEFDGRIDVGDTGVGSAYTLLEVLEELREELDIDEEEDEDEDEEEEEIDLDDAIEEQLRATWRTFLRAANTCIEKQVPLHVLT
jgi:hypothetical protein